MQIFLNHNHHQLRRGCGGCSLLLVFTLLFSNSNTCRPICSFGPKMVTSSVDFESANAKMKHLGQGDEFGKGISCTTFNILAPIYKRLDFKNQSIRESDYRAVWLERNQRILDSLLKARSSIICLQEFWVGNDEFTSMYLTGLETAGYLTFKLARTNNHGDGLLTSVHQDYFKVLNYREVLFNDFGDRVAHLLHVRSLFPFFENDDEKHQQEVILVNTHLLFPHDSSLSATRIHEAYKILHYLEHYQKENTYTPATVILCGDWNGSKRGHVYKFLRSQGFESSYDTAHNYSDNDADGHKWVSHRNHRGNICGVDFIWLLNPDKIRKPLKVSWADAVLGLVKYQLQKALLDKRDSFALFKADSYGDLITYSGFYEALRQINLIGHPYGLSLEEVKDLWTQADIDGNGVIDYDEFEKKIWNQFASKNIQEDLSESNVGTAPKLKLENGTSTMDQEAIGFEVKKASLYPEEVEQGIWPDDYNMSDHARLTVLFSPVKLKVPFIKNHACR